MPIEYPAGYTSKDDLDGDGIIDPLEASIKVVSRKQEISNMVDDRIKNEYLSKFRKEVDFHHKIAYRFERSYNLGKKNPERKQELDLEVIDLLSDFSDYI